jgi:hypothetical protein
VARLFSGSEVSRKSNLVLDEADRSRISISGF